MPVIMTCPDRQSLRALLQGDLPAALQDQLTEHLAACSQCPAVLEELATGDTSWSRVVRHVDRDTPPENSAFWPAMQALQNTPDEAMTVLDTRPSTDINLDFLLPSDAPGSLGRMGHFEILGVVGRGGMGIVLKALDPCLQRKVAIKVLDPQLANNDVAVQRFCREARAAAAVTHAHVVAIHAVDEQEGNGLPYLVMQLVEGTSLQEKLDKDGPLELEEILRVGMQTASGLAAAHAQGLIHRDVKPANILLEGGRHVRLTDFGLARAYADVRLTQTGFVTGTPLYMAPEQARGEPLDHRADLFSLGGVMYALCTGKAPFEGSTPFVVLKRVTEETPAPIRTVNPEVPEWLEGLIERLLAKKPSDRFQSAAEVAEALGHGLATLQQAGPAALNCPMVKAVRRRRMAVAAVLAFAVGALLAQPLGIAGMVGSWLGESSGPARAGSERAGPAPRAAYNAEIGPIWSVGVCPHCELLAVGLDDGTVKVWDPVEGRIQGTIRAHAGPVWTVTLSPHGGMSATASDDGTVKITTAKGRKELHVLRHETAVRAVAFSPDGKRVVTGARNGAVQIWDLATGQVAVKTAGHGAVVMAVAWSADGKTIATASGDKTAKLWDAATGEEMNTLSKHTGGVYTVAFSPDGKTVATGGWDKTVRLWETATGNEVAVLKGHTADVWSVAFSPDGKRLASGSEDRTMKLWDIAGRREVETFRGDGGTLYSVAFFPDGRTVASGGRDGTVRLWDVSEYR